MKSIIFYAGKKPHGKRPLPLVVSGHIIYLRAQMVEADYKKALDQATRFADETVLNSIPLEDYPKHLWNTILKGITRGME